MFTEPFMQRALIVGLCMAPLCALLGVFVTARRMAFFSDTISHGALAGIAIAFWMGFTDPTWPMVGFSVIVAGVLVWLGEKTDLLSDTILAVVLAGSVATGIVILSLLKGYRGEIQSYLFGDVLAVANQDILVAVVLAMVVFLGVALNLNELTLITVSKELAQASGVNVRILNYLFVLALTFVVALSIRLIGIILVTSLLVIPAAAAKTVSITLRQQIAWSMVFGTVSAVSGIACSFRLDTPCGPMIVLNSLAIFALALAANKVRNCMRSK